MVKLAFVVWIGTVGVGGCSSTAVGTDGGVDAASTTDANLGVELCGATRAATRASCLAADVGLSPENCRCGSHYYWSGSACVATAACRCTRNCDQMFETSEACVTEHAACASDAGTRD